MIYRQVLSRTTVNATKAISRHSSFNCEPICILPENNPFYIPVRIIKEVVSYLNTSYLFPSYAIARLAYDRNINTATVLGFICDIRFGNMQR